MEFVEFIRWTQVAGMLLGAFACVYFLYLYKKRWDLYNPYARFTIALNTLFIFTTASVALGRVFVENIYIEAVKSFVLLSVSLVLCSQLILMKLSSKADGEKPSSKAERN